MYKKNIIKSFNKDGFTVSLPNVNYKDISISFVNMNGNRRTFCNIKNSPIYYFIIKGNGFFYIDDKILVNKGDLIEIDANKKYTYSGNLEMLEILPKSFEELEIYEEVID